MLCLINTIYPVEFIRSEQEFYTSLTVMNQIKKRLRKGNIVAENKESIKAAFMETNRSKPQHIFIIGSKSIGQYGGYETFVNRLIREHSSCTSIKYHIACKANGDGAMDESKLPGVEITKKNENDSIAEFEYKNAHVFKIPCPNIGPAVAIYYDRAAVLYSLNYCRKNHIEHPIFYILTCRIGLFINSLVKRIKSIGGQYMLNPDGHEWKRAKWPVPIRKYWKWSEKKMVACADLVICDSKNIEKYIRTEYYSCKPKTTYIAYGADVEPSKLSDDDPKFMEWMRDKGIKPDSYYLVVGRFVPENNFETMIREFMQSSSTHDFALIANVNDKFLVELEEKLHWKKDPRIKFVGTVYDSQLLKKIRENAYAYFHGHSVGGTNPSLLEALGSTQLNLLLDVGFNREVGENSCLYWNLEPGNLKNLINFVETMDKVKRAEYGEKAKDRIRTTYSWEYIGDEYMRVWNRHIKETEGDTNTSIANLDVRETGKV